MFDARPVASRRRFPAWFLALGLLLGLNLLALIYVLLRDERAAVPRVIDAGTVAAAPLQTTPDAPAVTAATPVAAAPEATPPSRGTAKGTATAPAPTMRPAPIVSASAVPAAAAPPAAPARTRDDLLAAGDAVPDAQISLHVYDADAAKRFVFLDGQRLREGDVAANGLRVERIDADGVVLDHRGSDFKVRLEP